MISLNAVNPDRLFASEKQGVDIADRLRTNSTRPQHGGDIQNFCQKYGFSLNECLDLSTGISPWAWPVPQIPEVVWQQLPHSSGLEPQLLSIASAYYGCDKDHILAVPGSQNAIEILPTLALTIAPDRSQVAIPVPGYEEHGYCWQRAGHQTLAYQHFTELKQLVKAESIRHAVVINPQNPDASFVSPRELIQIARTLAQRGGFLVVDEAFVDSIPEYSMATFCREKGLVILRSIGKFFGLAGLRLGFVIAEPEILQALKHRIGLWSVSTPALWLATKLLADKHWIEQQTARLKTESQCMLEWAERNMPQLQWQKTDLFISGRGTLPAVKSYCDWLATAGICVRLFRLEKQQAILRIGLSNERGQSRLSSLVKTK